MAARDVAIVIKATDRASKTFEGVSSRLGGLAKAAKLATVAGIAGVVAIGGIAAKFAIDAAKVEQTRATFDKLAQSVGGTLPTALEKLRKATRGMVSDADLMLAGNKFLAMGLADTEDKAADLAQMATQLGMAMGEDATASMENFALMMANQSIPRLDSFGISSSKVRVRILELMEADKDMTREMAFSQAVMEQGAITMEKVGEQGEGTAAQMAQFRTVLSNLKLELGRAFLPILTKVMKALIPMAKLLASKLVPWVQKFAKILENLISRVGKRVKPFVEAIQGIGEAFGWLIRGDIDAFLERLWFALEETFGGRVANMITDFAEKIVGVAQTIKSGFERIRDAATGLWQSIYPRFAEIREGISNWWARIGGAGGILATIRTGWQTRIVDPIRNFYESSGLKSRFEQIQGGISNWWKEKGGVTGILETIKTGWATRIVGPAKEFYKSSGLQVRFNELGEGISEWWDGLATEGGALEKIKAGWQIYIADPLKDFWMNSGLAARFDIIRKGLKTWWEDQTKEAGVLGAISAGWKKYIADPVIGLWEEHLAVPFAGLLEKIDVWATNIWEFIQTKILAPLGLIAPTVKKATEEVAVVETGIEVKEDPRKGILGYLDRFREAWGKAYAGGPGFVSFLKSLGKLFTATAKAIWAAIRALVFLAIRVIPKVLRAIRDAIVDFLRLNENIRNMVFRLGGLEDAGLDTEPMWDKLSRWTNRISTEMGIAARGVNNLTNALRGLPQKIEIPIVVPVPIPMPIIPPPPTPPPAPSPPPPEYPPWYPPRDFQHGGTVPGPLGQPQLIVAHGGEQVGLARRPSGMTFDFRGAQFYGVTQDFVEDLFKEHELIRELQGVRGRNP